MTDKLKLYMDIQWRPVEWLLSAAGIRDKQKRTDVSREIGSHGLAAWMLGLDDQTIGRISECISTYQPSRADLLSGFPDNRNSANAWMVRVFDRECPIDARPHEDVNLVSIPDLENLLDLLRRTKQPTFLRCLETITQDKSKVNIFDGDVIQAGTRNGWDKLKTVIAISGDDGKPYQGHLYREMIWSESRGFFCGDRKLNLDTEHGYNSHVFTMQDGWRVLGNVYTDRKFLLPATTATADAKERS